MVAAGYFTLLNAKGNDREGAALTAEAHEAKADVLGVSITELHSDNLIC